LEQQTGDSPIGGQQQQPFRILVQPANGMRTFGKIKVEVAQQPYPV
jgi:hypothetical protein